MPDVTVKVQFRRDTSANWASVNPVLPDGEVGVDISTSPRRWKIGDGVTAWNDLPYGALEGPPGPQGPQGDSGTILIEDLPPLP